jgi:hypothetical protein
MSFNMQDYVDVKERIAQFYKKYPDGSIQFEYKGILESNPDMIWGIAYAYRTATDERPGIGTAAELAVGKTNFTRGSELMNLETSAWGRAIGALGIGLGKSVATRQEVEAAQARQEPSDDPWQERKPLPAKPSAGGQSHQPEMTEKQYGMIKALFNYSFQAMTEYVDKYKADNQIPAEDKLTSFWASKLITQLKAEGYIAGKKPNNPDPESSWN